jgi:tetratricopeptide (TPR) repeat protein
MDLPKYHLRLISDAEAAVFTVALNDQRRIKWARCASFSIKSGEIVMQDGTPPPKAMERFCKAWLSMISRAKKENRLAYNAIKAMGQLADSASKLESPLDGDLFETLIWTEASLKDALIANKGLALLADDDQEKYILQGQHYMNEGKFALAEAEYLKALENKANRANVNNFLAIALARQGKAAEAAKAMDNSILANIGNNRFVMRGAQYHLDAGNLDKAQAYIKQLANNMDLSLEHKLQTSRFALRAGLDDLGKDLAMQIVNKEPGHQPALEHLVNMTARTEGEAGVFKIIRQYIKTLPETPRLKEWYVRALIANDELERALKTIKDWIAADGSDFQAQFQLGRTYLAMRKPRSALRALTVAEEMKPDHAPTQKLIADACIALDDLSGAMEASGKACKIDPENDNFINQSKKITELLLAKSSKGN